MSSHETHIGHPLAGAEQLRIFRHPRSSRAEQLHPKLQALVGDTALHAELGIDAIVLDETSPDHQENTEKLAALLPGEAVAVAGGDGTQSDYFDIARSLGLSTPVISFAGGNANDLPNMLHKRRFVHNPRAILRRGKLAEFYPLSVSVHDGSPSPERHTAFGYASIGATGIMAATFDSAQFRDRVDGRPEAVRKVYEAIEIVKAVWSLQSFEVAGAYGNNQQYREINIMNGPRQAKILHCRESLLHKTALTHPAARYATVNGRGSNIGAITQGICRLASGQAEVLAPGQKLGYVIDQRGGVRAQMDGESFMIPNGATVSISISDTPVRVTTTRRHP